MSDSDSEYLKTIQPTSDNNFSEKTILRFRWHRQDYFILFGFTFFMYVFFQEIWILKLDLRFNFMCYI